MSLVVDPEAAAIVAAAVPSVDAVPGSQPVAWRHRHLLDVDGLTAADLELVMRTTDAMREVRMARAHQELVASDPDATTATLIAYTWGFGNYGRFAIAYRRRYGCTPSETLRRRITAERP